MKRLTKKVDGAWTAICEYGNPPYLVVTQDVIDRLAAIEDILGDEYELDWLKEVCEIKDNPGGLMGLIEELKKSNDIFLEVASRYSELGDYYRLRELAHADREGRCVVLPFKPPKWVYMRSKRFPEPAQAYYASAVNVLSEMGKGCVFGDTPEEAEAALKARE